MDFSVSFNSATIEEVTAIFKAISGALNNEQTSVIKASSEPIMFTVPDYVAPEPEPAPKTKSRKAAQTPPTVAPEPEEEDNKEDEETVTHDTLKLRAQKLSRADEANKAKIIALLKKAKVETISKLKPEHLDAFNKQLDKLEKPKQPEVEEDLPF